METDMEVLLEIAKMLAVGAIIMAANFTLANWPGIPVATRRRELPRD
jgi:hypothetical protein